MKKIIIILLVFSLLNLTGCGLFKNMGIGKNGVSDICEIANQSKPTKITTEVSYVTSRNDRLTGHYVTTTDGEDVLFEYYYEKLATPEESLASGNSDRIMSYEGVISYRDGVYYGDEELWKPGTGTAFDLEFHLDKKLLKDAEVDEDGIVLTAKVTPENLKSVLGTNLNALGDAEITVTTNGVNLTMVEIKCATASGNITIRTSYTYNPQDLFPVIEEEAEGTEGEEGTEEA